MSQKRQKNAKSTPNEFRFSINPFLGHYTNSSGEKPLYLRIGVNKKEIKISVGIFIHPKYWNRQTRQILPSHPSSSDYSLILRKAISKANDILITFRLKGEIPSNDQVQTQFHRDVSTSDFITFALQELNHRKSELSHETFRTHRGDILKLKAFSPHLGFNRLTYSFIDDFDIYMREKLMNRPNTRHKTHKTLKTYINRAIKKGFLDFSPYDEFRAKTQKTERTFLTRSEIIILEKLHEENRLSETAQNTLSAFLFACFCGGIRVSDLLRLNQRNIRGSFVVFSPQKTRETSAELIRIPLTDRAKKYMNPTGPLISGYSDQVMNRNLKKISEAAGLEKKITFHVSRHTFATLFLKAGGKVEVLMRLMGHQSLKTTMKYIHVTEESKEDQMRLLSNL